jgi:serine/threonine-protein kinase
VGAASPATALVVGRYALYGKIASGGMATVYFGRMLGAAGFTRTVAIKRLHPHLAEEPDFVSMMIDEARLVARVQHPNVAQTLDVVTEGGELLIVMEYVAGESLARLMRAQTARQQQVPPPLVSSVIGGMLHGLHAAHEAKSDRGVPLGMVHRDVSPHNVLVGVDGMTRVIDFGVAKAAGRLQTTRAGVVKGKLPYMAPEQLAGQETSRLADIYAAGVVLWEMLTGRRMFKDDDEATLLAQVLAGPKDRPRRFVPTLPAALDAVVMKALARDPGARFATAREMADALVRAVPPALATDVGAWVEDVARQVLDERSARLSDIESQSSQPAQPEVAAPFSTPAPVASRPPPLPSLAPRPLTSRPPPLPSVPPISSSRPRPAVADPLAMLASQPSSIAIETVDVDAIRAPGGRRTVAWFVAGVVATVAVVVAVILVLRPSAASSSAASRAAPSATVAAPQPSPPTVPVLSPPSPPSPSTPPPSAASAIVPEPVAAAAASAAASPGTAVQTSPPPPAAPIPARPGVTPVRPVRTVTPNPAGSVIFATPD